MTLVKICGITSIGDALAAQAFGADMLGINFYDGSKRFVSVTTAAAMFGDLQAIKKIGVFVNADVDELVHAIDQVKLDAVQLHGNEDAEFVGSLRKRTTVEIIKAVRVKSVNDVQALRWFSADSILLDTFSEKDLGGTGEMFDWQIALEAMKSGGNIYLAGGLNADNVAQAVRSVKPFAVDVASGVESSPGIKDHKKMEMFITNAKSA